MTYQTRSQLIAIDCALIATALMMVAMLFVGKWFPPIAPGLDAEAVARLYRENTLNYRFGGVLMMFAAVFFWPFGAAISEQMKRVEGYRHHPMASIQLLSLNGLVWAILFPSFLWMWAAFRPERAPDITQAMNDLGWLVFIGTVTPGMIQLLAIGYCAVNQDPAKPVFAPWFGFFNIWCATGFIAGSLVAFVKDGAFAWDGLISFWMAATFFFAWILVTWYAVRRAILEQAAELADTAGEDAL